MLDGGEDPAPAVVHREHPNAIGAPHEVRGMSDDLTVMGIAATAAAAMGREQIVLAHQAEHPLAGNPDVATDPKPSPDLAVALALPGDASRSASIATQQRLVRDRGLRSRRFAGGCSAAGRRSWRRTRSGPCPRRRRPAAGRRPDPCRGEVAALIAATSAPPKGRRSPSWPPAVHLHGQLSDPFMALSSSACTGSPLRCLSEASIRRSLSHATARAGRSLRPTGATEVAPARHAKAAERPHACAPPSIAGQVQRACRQSLAWGKRGRAKLARIYHRPINSNFLLKLSVMFRPPWTLRLSQFCVQGNRVRLRMKWHLPQNRLNRQRSTSFARGVSMSSFAISRMSLSHALKRKATLCKTQS